MESNITRDHIAMEAMKIIIEVSALNSTPILKRMSNWLFGTSHKHLSLHGPKSVSSEAYAFADAMIAEREKNKEE